MIDVTERHLTIDGELSNDDHIIEHPDAPELGGSGPAASDPIQGPLTSEVVGPEDPIESPADLDRLERVGSIPSPVRQDTAGQEA